MKTVNIFVAAVTTLFTSMVMAQATPAAPAAKKDEKKVEAKKEVPAVTAAVAAPAAKKDEKKVEAKK
jgi:hypothetical protein